MMYRRHTQGSTLVIVLILSTIMLLLAAALMQTVNSMYRDNMSRHHTKLAEEAAEAGAAYAKACIELSHRVQTWGPAASGGAKPNLTPGSDCAGTANAYPANQYVYTDDHVQTRFVVGDLDEHNISSVIISVTGYAERKRPGSSDVVKTYTHVIKKTIVWQPALVAQKSASGTQRTCGLLSGNVYCWGSNSVGQLGDGTTTNSLLPVRVVRDPYPAGIGAHHVTDIIAGSEANCMIIDTAEVYCWGSNAQGQLGANIAPTTLPQSSVPVKVAGLEGHTIVQLGASSAAFCALTDTGRLYCWGSNVYGQVGNNSSTRQLSPVLIGGPGGGFGALNNKTVTGVSSSGAFNRHLCAIAEGKAYCWGNNSWGELGNNPSGSGPWAIQRTPVAVYTGGVLSGKTVFSISGDGSASAEAPHTCAAAYTSTPADAKAYCWGSHTYGALGSNATAGGNYKTPVAVYTGGVMANTVVTEITTTAIGACVIAHPTSGSIDDSQAYCWGGHDTRGDGISGQTVRPVQVSDTGGIFAANRVSGIVGGAHRACAIVNNKAYCWGSNGVGQIGDGTTTHRWRPTESLFLRPRNNEFIF